MVKIVSAAIPVYPRLTVAFTDGAIRSYDVRTLFTYPPAVEWLSDPARAQQFRRTNRGGAIEWSDEVAVDVINLRYWKDDLDVHEWAGVAPDVPYAERLAIAEANLQRQRPDKVEIDLRHEVTPAEYARRKQMSIQAVQKQIERGTLPVRRIPELGLTLVRVA